MKYSWTPVEAPREMEKEKKIHNNRESVKFVTMNHKYSTFWRKTLIK